MQIFEIKEKNKLPVQVPACPACPAWSRVVPGAIFFGKRRDSHVNGGEGSETRISRIFTKRAEPLKGRIQKSECRTVTRAGESGG